MTGLDCDSRLGRKRSRGDAGRRRSRRHDRKPVSATAVVARQAGRRVRGQLTGQDAWAEQRDALEVSRRDFINAARREPVGAREPVSDVPVARPPLTEIRQMFDWPPGSVHEDDGERSRGDNGPG
jgi:hypothetical protein